MPDELAVSVMHLSIAKLALVPSVLSCQLACYFFPVLKPSFEFAPGTWVEELSLSMHFSVLKASVVDLSVAPVEEADTMLDSIHPVTFVVTFITVGLLSLALGAVVLPASFVSGLVECSCEPACAVELIVHESAPVEGAIGEDDQTVTAFC